MIRSERNGERLTEAMIIGILVVVSAIAGSILVVSAPIERLMGESAYGLRSAFHGLFAGIFMVTATIGVYQSIRLWSGTALNIRELEIGSVVNTAACFATILFGNWVYIPYRGPAGPKFHFLEKAPEVHKIFFEFKEFVALFTLPLAVAAAYVICRYGERLTSNKTLREMVALALVLTFFYFVVAFGLGAAITKLKSV